MKSELVYAIVTGGALAVVFIAYSGNKPLIKFSSDSDSADEAANGTTENKDKNAIDEHLSEEETLARTAKLQKVFNISDETVREAVRKTKMDSSNGYVDDPFNVVKVVEWAVFFGLLFGLCYWLNENTNGEFLRSLQMAFPREFETLGFGVDNTITSSKVV